MWNLVTEIETSTRINHHGLALKFARMRNEYEQTTILDRDTLIDWRLKSLRSAAKAD